MLIKAYSPHVQKLADLQIGQMYIGKPKHKQQQKPSWNKTNKYPFSVL